jgi:YHS domain-containing protein
MFKQMLMGLCALTFVGAGYTAVIAGNGDTPGEERVGGCGSCAPAVTEDASVVLLTETAPAKTDVKNTKCIVMPEDDVGDATVEHKGKVYHLCCKGCVKKFNKDPEKYVKAFDADPSKFGVK